MYFSISTQSSDRVFYIWLAFVFQTYFLWPKPISVHWPVLSMFCSYTNMIVTVVYPTSTLRTLRNKPFIWFVLWSYYKLVIRYIPEVISRWTFFYHRPHIIEASIIANDTHDNYGPWSARTIKINLDSFSIVGDEFSERWQTRMVLWGVRTLVINIC